MSLKSIHLFAVCLISFCAFFGCNESKFDYAISAELNPYKIAPLTAMLQIISEAPCRATIKVIGESPIEQSFETFSDSLSIPVVGLYPDKVNKVLVILNYEGGTVTDTVDIKTKPLPVGLPRIEINKLNRSRMEHGLHACDFHLSNFDKFSSRPMFFDDEGVIRWFLDLSFADEMLSPFQRLKDGTILVVSRNTIFEFDMLGKILKQTQIDRNYGMHHEALELPNGNLLICVGKRDAFINIEGKTVQSDSDFIILFDRENSKILQEWDLAKHLDVTRDDLNFLGEGDWLHMNALAFDEKDQSIIISGKNQGLVKITMDDELIWILSPNKNWKKSGRDGTGKDTKPFLLTAVNSEDIPYSIAVQNGDESHPEFDFPWAQHAQKLLPNGNIIVFDNGAHRNYNNENNYSRAVEYAINEDHKTVKQVWQYGKERGDDLFSIIIGDVDFLPMTKNMLVTSGHILPKSNPSGKIIEVDRKTGEEVFEATLYFKNVNGKKEFGWGYTDILYRSQRLELKY